MPPPRAVGAGRGIGRRRDRRGVGSSRCGGRVPAAGEGFCRGGGRGCGSSPRWLICRPRWQLLAGDGLFFWRSNGVPGALSAGRQTHRVQVFGDRHGGVRHLLERDCSIQRRHRRSSRRLRRRSWTTGQERSLHRRRCRGCGPWTTSVREPWSSSWTVTTTTSEMNTRLQVEHPVTEEILGWISSTGSSR